MLPLKLAWRNIWRNKRRTFITMASIIIAVLLSALLRSLQEGVYAGMIQSTVGSFSGYIQIHGKDYWEERTLDNSFAATDSLMQTLENTTGVTAVVPRIETFALAAGKNQSRPVQVMGIDVEAEQNLSEPKKRLQSGSYFQSNDEQTVVVGHEVLKRLNLQLGDSLVLIGQGFHGTSATGLYRVKGIVAFPNPDINKTLVMMPLKTAQQFLAAPGRLTTAALVVDNSKKITQTVQQLRNKLSSKIYEVMGWQEMLPELVQSIEADRGSGIIILGVLYMVVGFGVLGTILMMVTERTYEFGVMLSVGTPRRTLGGILAIEILFMAILASVIGILISFLIASHFHVNPIQLSGSVAAAQQRYGLQPMLQFSVAPSLFLYQALVVFIITLFFSLIPVIKASKLNPVTAMRA